MREEKILAGDLRLTDKQFTYCAFWMLGDAYILRHTDAGLTMNIYAHAQDPAKRAALEKFESRLVQ